MAPIDQDRQVRQNWAGVRTGLPAGLWLALTGVAALWGGIRNPLLSGYSIVIVIAYALLGGRGAALFAALSLTAAGALVAAEAAGWLSPASLEANAIWALAVYAVVFGLLGALLHRLSRPMREGLRVARRLQVMQAERARELDALLQAHQALLSTLELEPLLNNILRAAIDAIPGAEKGTILLVDPDSHQLRIRAVAGYADPRVHSFTFASHEGYSAKAMRERRPLLIRDARADAAIRYEGDIEEVRSVRGAIVAPLLLRQEPLGVLALDSTVVDVFSTTSLDLLVAFANTAAVAIHNAHLHAQVQAQAETDGLTGLANRRAFDRLLGHEVARAARYTYPCTLMFVDLDAFKIYNDTHGHISGDERLKATAQMLRDNLRRLDVAARYGGDEFAILLPHTDAGTQVLAERLRRLAQDAGEDAGAQIEPLGHIPGYTLSIGVAAYPADATTAADLLSAADAAEIEAKRSGKNRVVYASRLPPSAN